MLELSLSELNMLHYSMTQQLHQARKDAKQHGGWFAERLPKVQALEEKISNALYKRVREMESIQEEIREERSKRAINQSK